ncbi:MAG: hydrogen gas-evolving membrane-bound hydrogenase subunit E [Ilumatobacteraceae bacterium]
MFPLLILHAALGATLVALGERLGRRAFAFAAVAPLVTVVWLISRLGGIVDAQPVTSSIGWVDGLDLALELRADAFAAVMLLLVSVIGLAVCAYALGYFGSDTPGLGRLAGLMTMFAGAMSGLVLSDHLLSLFVFWELTSVTSYLLIGNDDTNPRARDAGLQALLITGSGGLVMLAGLVILGQAAGTYRLSELVAAPPAGVVSTTALVLVLVGAFTKSAQWPFSSWLPGAMVAPTPISTYLHAATMVKAGVYLVARLAPVFAVTTGWRPVVLVVGSVTMIVGGWRALRQVDLKVLLAHGTVSQLGFMMILVGAGTYGLAQAAVVVLLAHGAFKAALFMVVGVIDHQTHTRDIRRIGALGPGWGSVKLTAVLAAASMAGVPPLLGFIAKEKALLSAIDGHFIGAWWVVAAIVVGSILTFAYSARFVLGVLGRLNDPSAVDDDHPMGGPDAAVPSPAFVAPGLLLAVFSLVAGLAPVLVDALVAEATRSLHPSAKPKSVELWAGFNSALLLSAVVIAIGALVTVARRRVEATQTALHRPIAVLPTADRSFWVLLQSVLRGAKWTTRVVQNGSLPIYLMVILGVSALAPLVPALTGLDRVPVFADNWLHIPLAALIVAAAIGSTLVHRRIAAALMLGAVGYGMAGLYVVQGAPDLALTQFAIETLATVLFVLVLQVLPRAFTDRSAAVIAPVRIAIAALVGVSVFVFALSAADSRGAIDDPSVSAEMLDRSVPDGKGANVVNVILVDFRGLDTLGEITVLLVAGLGVVALARLVHRKRLETSSLVPSPVVDASARVLFASILTLAIYFLFAGHNQPGGGFVGGLTAGAAISLLYIAGGNPAVRRLLPMKPWTVLGGGLLIAVVTAIVPILLGGAVLEHALLEADLPFLGKIKTTSALPFDIGVFLVVVGLVLMAYEAFGDDPEASEEDAPTMGDERVAVP